MGLGEDSFVLNLRNCHISVKFIVGVCPESDMTNLSLVLIGKRGLLTPTSYESLTDV
jgi:hypothetical protein